MSLVPGAALAPADPRQDNKRADSIADYSNRELQTLFDPNVTLEEYMYYAKETRQWEEMDYGQATQSGPLSRMMPGWHNRKASISEDTPADNGGSSPDEKGEKRPSSLAGQVRERKVAVSEEEWYQASRAARTATWSAVFYLITTDILGPFTVPYAFTQLGWGPGTVLYTIFGVLAVYSGYQVWVMFLALDSDRYPLKGYGDIGFRIYGNWFRHICNVFQSFQFFFNVGLLILGNGQGLSQLVKGPNGNGDLCFIVCLLIIMLAGCLLGQVRTLARFGWIANLAIWLNLLTIFFTMGVVANSGPNYTANFATNPSLFPNGVDNPPPVQTTGGSPPGLQFTDNVTGLMQAVFSYGGATLFAQLMAEMRRPWDFWKGLLCADLVIFLAYMLFGMFVYGYQGQYAYNPAYQGINPYSWQTVCNTFQLVTGIIAACLYGNIGIKVLYLNVFQEGFKFPRLESTKGKWIWVAFVPIYWIAAWVVATSIPQFSNFGALVGALFILQFTYTFPPFMVVGYRTQRDAMLPEETFSPQTGVVQHSDSGMKRWIRGYKKKLLLNIWDTIYSLGALVTAILGTYAAIYRMNEAYNSGNNQVSWSCKSPTG